MLARLLVPLVCLGFGTFGSDTLLVPWNDVGPCVCPTCPDAGTVTVCQGSLVTKVTIRCNLPNGFIARIKSFAKSQSDGMSSICMCINPVGTWGEVDQCEDIQCECK